MLEKANIENVWKKFKDGQVSVSKAQIEIDKLFLVQKGFFKRLEDNLTRIVTERISNQTGEYMSTSAYLCKQRKLERELIQKSNWVNFWLVCPWLKAPTSEDIFSTELTCAISINCFLGLENMKRILSLIWNST